MTRRGAALGGGLLVLGLLACDGSSPPPVPPPPPVPAPPPPPPPVPVEDGALEGTLLDGRTIRPLAGRAVATAADGRTWSDHAAMDGRFRIGGLPRGEWISVEARAPGLGTRAAVEMEVPLVGDGQLCPLRMEATGDLPVEVVDGSGKPVAGATVFARRPLAGNLNSGPIPLEPWPVAARGTAGEGGSAVLEDLPPGTWALFAAAPGFARGSDIVEHHGGPAAAPHTVVLRPGYSVEGFVRFPGGEPAAGAVVAALESGTGWSDSMSCLTTTADAAGRFRLEGLGKGTWPILVRAFPGVLEPAGRVEAPSASPRDLWLPPRAAMEGVVSDASNRMLPVAGALVSWVLGVHDEDSDNDTARVEARTDATGRYRRTDLPEGTLMFFEVSAPGCLPCPDSMTPLEGGFRTLVPRRSVRVDAAVHRGAAVRGTVRDLYGAPVRDAWVQVRTEAENPFCRQVPTAWTGADGRFVIPSAHPGDAVLASRGPGLHSGDSGACSVVVPREGEVSRDLVLVPDARVRGRVLLADGSAAAGFRPRIVRDDGGRGFVAEGGPTGEGGWFDFWVDHPGPGLRVVAEGPKGARASSPPFDLEEGQFLDAVVAKVPPGARLSGTVRRWDGGPLRGVALQVIPLPGGPMQDRPRSFRDARTVPVAEDGSFAADGLPAGAYAIACTAEGCSEARGPRVQVAEGEEKAGVEVVLPRGWEVAGLVLGASGEPIDGAEVFVWPAGRFFDRGASHPATTTDSRGGFRTGGLPEGKHDLRVRAAGHPDAFLAADAGAVDLRVVLEPGFTIRGRILDAETGRPAGGLPVSAWQEGHSRAGLFERRGTTSAVDGTFALEGLHRGACEITVCGQRSFRHGLYPETHVRGVAAGTKDLVLRIERARRIAGRLVDPEGRPVTSRGLRLMLHCPWTGRGWSSVGSALQPDGTFIFDGLAPGRYALAVEGESSGEARDTTWLPARVEGVAAGREDLVVTLRRGKPIAGRMEADSGGTPRKGFWVHAGCAGSRKALPGNSLSKVRGDGTFSTGALEEGREYDLSVREGRRLWVARGVAAGAEGVLLRPEPLEGTISGTVVDGEGRPVPAGVRVTAEPRDSTLSPVQVETAEGGTFVLAGLGTVPCRVRAGGPGCGFAWDGTWPTLAPGTKGAAVRVRRGEFLRGTLRTGNGAPVKGTLVLVLDGGGEPVEHRVWTGGDGKFEVGGLPPGPLAVKFDCGSPGGRDDPEVARVRLPCGPLDLRAPEEGDR